MVENNFGTSVSFKGKNNSFCPGFFHIQINYICSLVLKQFHLANKKDMTTKKKTQKCPPFVPGKIVPDFDGK